MLGPELRPQVRGGFVLWQTLDPAGVVQIRQELWWCHVHQIPLCVLFATLQSDIASLVVAFLKYEIFIKSLIGYKEWVNYTCPIYVCVCVCDFMYIVFLC